MKEHFYASLVLYSLHSMIEVSAEAWDAILYLITPWQYLPRLGVLFSILSRLGSNTVSDEAWHAILYLTTLPAEWLKAYHLFHQA